MTQQFELMIECYATELIITKLLAKINEAPNNISLVLKHSNNNNKKLL